MSCVKQSNQPGQRDQRDPQRHLVWRAALLAPVVAGPLWVLLLRGAGFDHFASSFSGFLLAGLLAAASYTDMRWRRIPNWATYTAVLWALVLNAAAAAAPTGADKLTGAIGLRESLLGAATCFLLMLLIYQFLGVGGGDVKLAVAIGALIGIEAGVSVLVWCYITAGAAALFWLVWKTGPWRLTVVSARFVGGLFLPMWIAPPRREETQILRQPIPLAAFFAVGTVIVLVRRIGT